MRHKDYLLLILLKNTLTFTTLLPRSTAHILPKLSFTSSSSSNSSSSTAAQIFCDSTSDCPAHSVCYQNNCICDFGYTFQQKVLCVRLHCSTDLDCQGIFLHSKCISQQFKSYCTCSDDAYLDPFNQECYEKMNHVVLWFGFLTILGIIIFLPAGKLFAKHREIQRQNRQLEAEQRAAQGPLGTLSFGNAGVVNYDDAFLHYYHTVNNSHSSNVIVSTSHAGYGKPEIEVQNDCERRWIQGAGLGNGRGSGSGSRTVKLAELKVENIYDEVQEAEAEIENNNKNRKKIYFRSMSEQ